MRPKIALPLLSMLRSAQRIEGRTWITELCARVVRQMFHDGNSAGVQHLRRLMDSAGNSISPKLNVEISERLVSGIRCVVTRPDKGNDITHLLIYFHGGGFVSGSPQGYQNLLSLVAQQSNAIIVAPDYRLSPEHVFPAAQEDCLKVSKQLLEEFGDLKIIIGGDSAGGNLAISTVLELSDDKAKGSMARIADGLLLISPWVEPTTSSGSIITKQSSDIFEPEFLLKSYAAHMGSADLHDPRVNFRDCDLSAMPTTYVQCGGGEQFVDQIQQFNERAKSEGVDIELDVYDAQFHDFQALWPVLKEGKAAVEKLADFIRHT